MSFAIKKTIAGILAFGFLATQANATSIGGEFSMRSSIDPAQELDEKKLPEKKKTARVFVIDQPLNEFLRQAARRSGYEITLSKKVRGTVRKTELPLNMEAILKKLSSQFDLKWFFQGNQIHVSVGSETTSRVIFLDEMKFEELQKAMSDADLGSQDFKLSYVEDSNSVLVNGPTAYLANIELLTDSYNKKKKSNKNKVKVIRFGTVGK